MAKRKTKPKAPASAPKAPKIPEAPMSHEDFLLKDISDSQDMQDAPDREDETDADTGDVSPGWHYTDDWGIIGIYADYLGDHGRTEEEDALRWMIDRKKRAYKCEAGEWAWFCADKVAEGIGEENSDLPEAIFTRLEGFFKEEANHKKWKTFVEAQKAAIVVIMKLTHDKAMPS